jgi:hypothetical protein
MTLPHLLHHRHKRPFLRVRLVLLLVRARLSCPLVLRRRRLLLVCLVAPTTLLFSLAALRIETSPWAFHLAPAHALALVVASLLFVLLLLLL